MNTIIPYLFSLYPPTFEKFGWLVFAFFTAILVFSIIITVYAGQKRKLLDGLQRKFFQKLKTWGYFASLIGFLLWFLRFETIPWLSMRFLLWAWIGFLVAWLCVVAHYKAVVIPRRRREIALKDGKAKPR